MNMAEKLIGNKYGKLQVIRLTGNFKEYSSGSKDRYVWAKCECGKEREFSSWQIKSGHTKSCGCWKIEVQRKFRSPEDAVSRILMKSYKTNAKSRNISWELSLEEFKKLIQQSCFWCNSFPPLKQMNRTNENKHWSAEWKSKLKLHAHGVDRIDNNKGYLLSNVVTCCKQCNLMKHAYSVSQFLSQVEKIYINSIKVSE